MTANGGQWRPLVISMPCTHTLQENISSDQWWPVAAKDGHWWPAVARVGQWWPLEISKHTHIVYERIEAMANVGQWWPMAASGGKSWPVVASGGH